MFDDDEKNTAAMNRALVRLTVREYGAREMKTYLTRKGYAADEIETAVNDLVARGLISDLRFSKIIARHAANRGKGPGYIQGKLRQKGVKVEKSDAKKLFDETSSETELELARRILEVKYPKAHENMKEKQKAYQGLIRRGISHDIAQTCFRKARLD